MIISKPKSSTLFAIGLFLLIILGTTIWIFYGLLVDPASYLIWKLVLVPTLLVIFIVVAIKSYFAAIYVKLGKERLTYRYRFGREKTVKLSELVHWDETIIKRKGSTYRQLAISLNTGKKLKLSNQENSQYEQMVKYLKKKVRMRN